MRGWLSLFPASLFLLGCAKEPVIPVVADRPTFSRNVVSFGVTGVSPRIALGVDFVTAEGFSKSAGPQSFDDPALTYAMRDLASVSADAFRKSGAEVVPLGESVDAIVILRAKLPPGHSEMFSSSSPPGDAAKRVVLAFIPIVGNIQSTQAVRNGVPMILEIDGSLEAVIEVSGRDSLVSHPLKGQREVQAALGSDGYGAYMAQSGRLLLIDEFNEALEALLPQLQAELQRPAS